VSEGTRTPDRLDHNQELYQLSYAHRGAINLPASRRSYDPKLTAGSPTALVTEA
jgi:hypothetical protein